MENPILCEKIGLMLACFETRKRKHGVTGLISCYILKYVDSQHFLFKKKNRLSELSPLISEFGKFEK